MTSLSLATLSRFPEVHTSTIGANAIWLIGEYIEDPKDRRKFLLWTSQDIRQLATRYLPNWIDHDLRTLGYQGDKPDFITRVFSDLTLGETENKILQAVSGIAAIAASDNQALNRLAIFSPDEDTIREFTAATDESERDVLLCQIVNNPKTSDRRARQVYKLLSDDSTIRISGIMHLALMGPALMCVPFGCFMLHKCLDKKRGSFLGHYVFFIFGSVLPGVMMGIGASLALAAPKSYKEAIFGKHPICRKKWRISHAILAGSAISLYAFFRSKQDSIPLDTTCFFDFTKETFPFPSTIAKIARFSCDILAVACAIAETGRFLGI